MQLLANAVVFVRVATNYRLSFAYLFAVMACLNCLWLVKRLKTCVGMGNAGFIIPSLLTFKENTS